MNSKYAPGSRLACLLGIAALACGVASAEVTVPALFSETGPIEITITADFERALSNKRGWSTDRWHAGEVALTADGDAVRRLPVRIRLRAGFRTRDKTCYFPQMFIDFSPGETQGTAFAGQKILALTTHCKGSSTYSRYVHREYIAYRLYQLLSDKALRVRKALITYMRSDKPEVVARRYAFFVEHFDDLAARLGAEPVSIEGFHPISADPFEMGVLELFQFMIGNTDWSAAFQHNILLLRYDSKPITAIPFDFDFSGLVNARYATPAKQFRTKSVRTRIYRGWCRDQEEVQRVVDHFQAKRAEVFAMIRGFGWMGDEVIRDSVGYLDSFYDVLDAPGEFNSKVIEKCARGVPVRPPGE